MSRKFYFVDLETLYEIEKMMIDRQINKDIVLQSGNGFADVVRYNSTYNTAVFLTVKAEDIRR